MNRATELLKRVQSELDIPEDIASEAAAEFKRVAEWLADGESALSAYEPELYPQGSFRLGTPVRPVSVDDDFDIDLVCQLNLAKEQTTQADLKDMVGTRLSEDPKLSGRVIERRRCWQLSYRPRYHLDVLPAIPDTSSPPTSILLSDRDLHRWQFSDPIGYADWFFDCMRVEWEQARKTLAITLRADIEDVPNWRIRTPLQRAVQLLKRHRDIRFSDDPDLRPVSIVITTLAGRAYRSQEDLGHTVLDLAERMPMYIEKRGDQWWVENPAQPRENFADKWNEHRERKEAFTTWLEILREDVLGLETATTGEAPEILEERFGVSAAHDRGAVRPASIPALGDLSHVKSPPWPRRIGYSCEVTARAQFRKGGPLFRLGQFLFKQNRVKFEATTNAPPPYEVRWQVVNTGQEARAANDLRGDFDEGAGEYGDVRWERTRYTGTHQARAFVLKDGTMVGASDWVRVRIAR